MCLEAVGPCQGTPHRAGRSMDTSRSTIKNFTLPLSPDLGSSGPRCGHDQYTWHCYLPLTITRTSLETLSNPAMWPHRLGGRGHQSRSSSPPGCEGTVFPQQSQCRHAASFPHVQTQTEAEICFREGRCTCRRRSPTLWRVPV